jgi:hypothetical protein
MSNELFQRYVADTDIKRPLSARHIERKSFSWDPPEVSGARDADRSGPCRRSRDLVEARLEQLGAEGMDAIQGRDQDPELEAVTVKVFGYKGEFAIQKEVGAQRGCLPSRPPPGASDRNCTIRRPTERNGRRCRAIPTVRIRTERTQDI